MILKARALFLSVELALAASIAGAAPSITWTEVATLPPAAGETTQPGQAGPFAGVHGDAMLIAGGANFPKGLPWQGGVKVWSDHIFILDKKNTAVPVETTEVAPLGEPSEYRWSKTTGKLPRAAAYGVSITLENGVLCVGGCDAQQCFADTYVLHWNPQTDSIGVTEYPPLPTPLAFMSGALVGEIVFVAGGQTTMSPGNPTKNFYSLDLSKKDAGNAFRWEELPAWNGPGRILPVAAAASNGTEECFYLFSGRCPKAAEPTEILADAHQFVPSTGAWTELDGVRNGAGEPRCIMAASACRLPGGGLAVFGGADGVIMQMLEHNGRKARSGNAEESKAFSAFNAALLGAHPGFGRDVLFFDPTSNQWSTGGVFPAECPVTVPAVRWGDSVFLPSGEIRPGVRSPKIWKGQFSTEK
jgi:SSS family solute:Na+ symporter